MLHSNNLNLRTIEQSIISFIEQISKLISHTRLQTNTIPTFKVLQKNAATNLVNVVEDEKNQAILGHPDQPNYLTKL